MNLADPPVALLPIDPEVAWTMLVAAAIAFAVGGACAVAPGKLIALQIRMLEWQRRVFGNFTVDWHLNLVRHPVAPWIVRMMGAYFVLVGAYLGASAVAAMSAAPA